MFYKLLLYIIPILCIEESNVNIEKTVIPSIKQ